MLVPGILRELSLKKIKTCPKNIETNKTRESDPKISGVPARFVRVMLIPGLFKIIIFKNQSEQKKENLTTKPRKSQRGSEFFPPGNRGGK